MRASVPSGASASHVHERWRRSEPRFEPLGVEDHGTELEHREDTPLMADPSLGEEDGSGPGQLDQCPEDYEQRKEPEQGRRRQIRSRARFTAIRGALPTTGGTQFACHTGIGGLASGQGLKFKDFGCLQRIPIRSVTDSPVRDIIFRLEPDRIYYRMASLGPVRLQCSRIGRPSPIVTGRLVYDLHHEKRDGTPELRGHGNSKAGTLWEVHPVFAVEIPAAGVNTATVSVPDSQNKRRRALGSSRIRPTRRRSTASPSGME